MKVLGVVFKDRIDLKLFFVVMENQVHLEVWDILHNYHFEALDVCHTLHEPLTFDQMHEMLQDMSHKFDELYPDYLEKLAAL
ncbi:hypothetical protein CLV36_11722 [Laceyella sediminis]|jgi:hypothetical protein|uniref:Uncharacterized protein n=2 Tax=Laceyella TaxID=292635 RepID=A0AA46AD75_9BACL|nr:MULTISPECIES: hypothetical protein [Laceyella]PRZ12043.1 hypothetical protein CLV36_11722 [Laceyella sediminis]SMP03015.1 hypothetical protein SAMN06265361_101397 [Laceyella tengchongensis]